MARIVVIEGRKLLKRLAGVVAAGALAVAVALLLRPASPAPVTLCWRSEGSAPLRIVAEGSPEAPPYTLPAFRRALSEGARALYLPLRFTADGEPVVFPTAELSLATDGQGTVDTLPLADLQALDAGYRFTDSQGGFPFRGHGLQVPLLEEVLAAFPGVPLLLELADPSPSPDCLDRLARVVKRWEAAGTILLAPGSPPAAKRLRQLLPATPAVATAAEAASFLRLARFGLAGFTRPAFNVLWLSAGQVTPRAVAAAHRRRLMVFAGPVSSPAEVQRLTGLGVDGLILRPPARPAE